MEYLVGIDEAGRGPLAGPVAVGVVKVANDFDWNQCPGVHDSKQLSPKQRREIYKCTQILKKAGELDFAVAMVGAKIIDRTGIVSAIRVAMQRAIKRLELSPNEAFIKLDGGLYAPVEFSQSTIIKGDQSEKEIGLASIMAKETRDAYMCRKAIRFPAYDFATHKGYGTKFHRQVIKEWGLCVEHRHTFCRGCINAE